MGGGSEEDGASSSFLQMTFKANPPTPNHPALTPHADHYPHVQRGLGPAGPGTRANPGPGGRLGLAGDL